MKKFRAAFTLYEMLVTVSLSGLLGSIIYSLSMEAVSSFAQNVSINRSYSEARLAIDRISTSIQSAGHVPAQVDASGKALVLDPAKPPVFSAGIRFYRYGAVPSYPVQTAYKINSTSLTITYDSKLEQAPPLVGDVIAIPGIGFQAAVTSVTSTATTATVAFSGTMQNNCLNKLDFTYNTPLPNVCLVYSRIAFVTVPVYRNNVLFNYELRYYPTALEATDASTVNPATDAFDNPKNYQVICNLAGTTDAAAIPARRGLPFYDAVGSVIQLTLFAEAPDYNKRYIRATSGYAPMQTSQISPVQTSLASRCPLVLRAPY